MSSDEVLAAVAALRAAVDDLDACDLDSLTATEAITVLDALQDADNRLPATRNRALAQLQRQTTAHEIGAKSWRDVLTIRWRLSGSEAGQRLTHATLLAPRPTVTGGDPLPPQLEAVAAAQRLGFLTTDHVELLRKGIAKLPGWTTPTDRDHWEVQWVRYAVGAGPKELADHIERRLFLLDQDGPPPDDRERQLRRTATLGPQAHDGMSVFTATLTPTARATLEALLAKYAAPGMCNPADEHPCTSGTPSQAQIDADDRSLAQRQHDALEFLLRSALEKGELGHLNGVPTSILIRTTLTELMTLSGIAYTGGGSTLPITDVLQLAAEKNATSYLGIFDHASNTVLDFYRARRTASTAQRLAAILRDGGCTKPGCPVPAYGSQVHHTVRDWSRGGRTNVNEMSLACGGDNRLVSPGGWTTTMNAHHDTEWHPPPALDTGQHRTNHYHHPERLNPPHDTTWTPPAHHGDSDGGSESAANDDTAVECETAPDDDAAIPPAPPKATTPKANTPEANTADGEDEHKSEDEQLAGIQDTDEVQYPEEESASADEWAEVAPNTFTLHRIHHPGGLDPPRAA